MILLAVIRLGDEAYGSSHLSKEPLETTGRNVALGSVYAALDRLEQKQLVSSTLGDPTPARGGCFRWAGLFPIAERTTWLNWGAQARWLVVIVAFASRARFGLA